MRAYCAGDPINHTDPTGHKLKLVGGTAEQRGEYRRAKAYLRKSNTGNKLIKKLKRSKKEFKIKFVKGANNNEYDPYNRIIKWDHRGGWFMKDTWFMRNETFVMSTALNLAHEMGHAAQHLDGGLKSYMKSDSKRTLFKVENANVKKYETPIARQLGEPTRASYGGVKGLRRMNNSTHFITTYYAPGIFGDKYIMHHNQFPLVGKFAWTQRK